MSSSRQARAAIVFGVLAIAAIPAGGAVSYFSTRIGVLFASVIAVPAAFVLGLIGLSLARRASLRLERSIRQSGGRTVRTARLLVWAGLYLAVTGALALGFYGALRARA